MALWTPRTRRAEQLAAHDVAELGDRWRRTCEGAGLYHRVDTVTGPTITIPRLRRVQPGHPLVLHIELLPGQVLADIEANAHRIAPAFGARRLQVIATGPMTARLEFLAHDPLVALVPYVPRGDGLALLGRDEHGHDITADWAALPHAVVQGVTRSGKSGWLYAQLAALARRPHTLIAGSDPSGLLWRPWTNRWGHDWRISGLAELDAHAEMLDRLVCEMDSRIATMPTDRDTVPIGPACSLVVCVMEEYPGLLRKAGAKNTGPGARIRSAVARLLAESHKAGIRMVLVAQRADADVIGGFERAMCGLRVSFRVENADALRMLHPGMALDRVDEHMTAPDGVALLTAPGRPLTRLRGPWIGDYAGYRAAVDDGGSTS